MYKLRVGNDINIQWRIFRTDKPEDFAGKELRLLMRGTSQTIEVTGYTIEGNVLNGLTWVRTRKARARSPSH